MVEENVVMFAGNYPSLVGCMDASVGRHLVGIIACINSSIKCAVNSLRNTRPISSTSIGAAK
jgi:hypothetical protein